MRTPEDAEEGQVDTVIRKNGKVLAHVPCARPISFSPDGAILLLDEAAPEDDCRHFLLNIAAGEYSKDDGSRLKWVIGSRYASEAKWSSDSKKLILSDSEEMG